MKKKNVARATANADHNCVIAYLPDFLSRVEDGFNTTHPLERARKVFSMFNLIGCPLLLTCMCIERYVAVVKPLLYLSSKKWEYRMAVSSLVWCVTGCFCVVTGKS